MNNYEQATQEVRAAFDALCKGRAEAAVKTERESATEGQKLKEAVKELFNTYLNRVEESDSGYPFHPVTVSCCRVMLLKPLGELLETMRELSGADKDGLKDYYDH